MRYQRHVRPNDGKRLRIDIILNNSISLKWKVIYTFEIKYKGGVRELYIFYPIKKKFQYIKKRNGKIVIRKWLKQSGRSDRAFYTSATVGGRRLKRGAVTLLIDKRKHIRGRRGKKLWLTARIFSGFISKRTGKIKEADRTRSIRLGFRY